MKEEYSIIDIVNLQKSPDVIYMNNDVVLLSNLDKLPHSHNNIKVNIGILIICVAGKMSVSINAKPYIIQTNEILVCAPNTELNDCMVSSDFKVGIIGMTPKMLVDHMQMANDFWKKEYYLQKKPVICVSKDRLELFSSYFSLLKLQARTSQREYENEIMTSLIRVLIYEILSEVEISANTSDWGKMIQQKDVLFKRFMILLSSTQVKPRTVAWYAEKLYVTPKHLSMVCKLVSGKTAFNWINEYVMADITRMLKHYDKSIKEVANNLGFPNIAFFGKYVKSHTGHNPTDYRKLLRESKKV